MFLSCLHAFSSLRIESWLYLWSKTTENCFQKGQIFNICNKTLFFSKKCKLLWFHNRDIYLSKLLLFKKTPDLAFSDIELKHIQRWASHSKKWKSCVTLKICLWICKIWTKNYTWHNSLRIRWAPGWTQRASVSRETIISIKNSFPPQIEMGKLFF